MGTIIETPLSKRGSKSELLTQAASVCARSPATWAFQRAVLSEKGEEAGGAYFALND